MKHSASTQSISTNVKAKRLFATETTAKAQNNYATVARIAKCELGTRPLVVQTLHGTKKKHADDLRRNSTKATGPHQSTERSLTGSTALTPIAIIYLVRSSCIFLLKQARSKSPLFRLRSNLQKWQKLQYQSIATSD
jgi:hypothetical protein